MSEIETIEAEVEEIVGQALEVAAPAPVSLFRTEDPVEIVRRATETAEILTRVLREKNLTKTIQGKEHVLVDGWTLLGTMLGVFPVLEWTRRLEHDDGWEARVEARTLTGATVGAAEAQCTRKEKMWSYEPVNKYGKKLEARDDHALRSMAQTRATSKALRQPLGFVVSLAGFEVTPAEEMPRDSETPEVPTRVVEGPEPLPMPRSWAKVTEYVAAYDEATHDLFFRYGDAARRYLFPGSTDTASLKPEEKKELLKVSAGAALALRNMADASKFPPPGDDEICEAWASVLEGQKLVPSPPPEPEAPDPETFE